MVVQNGSVDLVYLADRTSPNGSTCSSACAPEALATDGRRSEALYREPNPADGGTANTLAGAHPAWHLGGRRTGDLVVTHTPGGAFSDPGSFDNPLTGNHGGPQTRDNFFAVTSGGDAVRSQALAGNRDVFFDDTTSNPGQAENVDVAPTVMGLFGLQPPTDNAGRFLSEAFNLGAVPGAGTPPSAAGRARLHVRRLTRRRCAAVRRYGLRWTPRGAGTTSPAGRTTAPGRCFATAPAHTPA